MTYEDKDRRTDARRELDQQWIRSVDHQLVTALTGHQVLDRRVAELEIVVKEIDRVLRGDPAEDLDGISTQLHQMQTDLSRLNAVIFMDSTGRKGLQKDVEELRAGEHRAEYRLKFWAPVIVAFISLAGLLATNWDRITNFVRRPDPDPVAKEIENAKHPRPIRRHYTIYEGKDQ